LLAPAIGIGTCLVYVGALWWLLRREPAVAFVGIAALCGVALATRVWQTTDFPAGLVEDEPKFLRCAGEALQGGAIFRESCIGIPMLLGSVFEAQLIPVVGPNRWAVRSYSMITGILAVAAAFAVGRSLGLHVAPSWIISAAVAAFPWSIFFGRISLGGELVFHELLVVAALVRFIWASGGWVEIGFGGVALCALLYDYFVGRTMVGLTLVAAVLARGRYRLYCLALLALALLGWLPFLLGPHQYAGVGFSATGTDVLENPLGRIRDMMSGVLRALVWPVGRDDWFTVRSAAVHQPWFLGLALIGSFAGIRRGLFLWAGFLGGLAPAILSIGRSASAHRMLMAFPFIAMAAACAVNLLPWRRVRVLVALLVIVASVTPGVLFYFSPEFWPAESQGAFDTERTQVVESLALPPHAPIILMKQLRYQFGPRTLSDNNYQVLTAENWYPPSGAVTVYAFDRLVAPLRPFYEHIMGPERVRAFGNAFTVTTEARDWSWLKEHGWTYEASCGKEPRRAQVPALFHVFVGFESLICTQPIVHHWEGRWLGPTQQLRFYFSGAAEVSTTHGVSVSKQGYETSVTFVAQPDDIIRITLINDPPVPGALVEPTPVAILSEVSPVGDRVPLWEHVSPVGAPDRGAAG